MYARENGRTSSQEDVLQAGTGPVIWVFDRKSNLGRRAVDHLEQEGFSIRMLAMRPDVIQRVKPLSPSVVMIEATSPDGFALQLCREIRRLHSFSRTPVVLISANASEEERVIGLESGADDYITESSSGREIVVRVRAAMRRFNRQDLNAGFMPHAHSRKYSSATLGPPIRRGDIEIDATAMTISVRGDTVATTNLEFRLLCHLVHNQGRVLTRDQLLDAVWGAEFVELRSVDACIRRLRRKIEPQPVRPIYLKTVRGAGYCLRVGDA